jgi:hypothetical protein
MLSTELEYVCTELECFLKGWNALDTVGIPLHRVELLSRGLECFLKVGMLSIELKYLCTELEYLCTGLKCFLEG